MSWFDDDAVLVDERPLVTVAEGVTLERRSLLRFSAATVAACLATSCVGLRESDAVFAPPTTDGRLDVAEFLAELYPYAQGFVASGGEREDAYLATVRELMQRLHPPEPRDMGLAMRDFHKAHATPDMRFEMWVLMFDLEPGKGFTPHDHRDYNGMIRNVKGEAHVTNYEIQGDEVVPAEGTTFQIRRTREATLRPGDFSSLGVRRDNVHELTAGPEGAVLLDAFTFLAKGARSYSLDVDPTPREPERGLFDASWA